MKPPILSKLLLSIGTFLSKDSSFQLLKEIEPVETMSAEAVRELQIERLKDMLQLCNDHVPYYTQLFKEREFVPSQLQSISDLKKLPIINKKIIRQNSEGLINQTYSKDDMVASATGGSTGDPLNFYREKNYIQRGAAGMWRAFLRCGWQPGDNVAYVWGCSPDYYSKSTFGRVLRAILNRIWWFDTFNASEENLAHWVKVIKRVKPTVMFGYASSLDQLAQYVNSHQIDISSIKGVYSTAETLFDNARANMEKAFGCKVYNFYGSCEVLNISCECPKGKMHINSDFVVVEQGESVDETHDEMIVTSLWNRAMPFIRYSNGDMGKLSDEICSCSLPYPLLELNIGRVGNIIRFPNGNSVSGHYFEYFIYGTDGIKLFQIHQKSTNNITLRIVKDEAFGAKTENKLGEVEQRLKEKGGNVNVEIEYVNKIPLTRQGKHLYIISDL